jgi:hypothetical protein
MGWRKLTIQDGDLARCCAAQGPVICEASLEVCFAAAASSLALRHWPTAALPQTASGPTQSWAVGSAHVEFDSAAIGAPGMQDGAF